jgi:type IV secretory pathway ATPase VirB11/archaellum biosynthesis ATPase
MLINSAMDLEKLTEYMDVNNNGDITINQAKKMRQLLVAHANAFEWVKTHDVDDSDWFRLLKSARTD